MADEQLAIAPSEPASSPAIEQGGTQDDTPAIDLDAPIEDVEAEPEDDHDDYQDDDGTTYRLPRKLIPRLMKDADYTQKSQANAATKKELDAERTRIAEQAKATEEDLNDRATVQSIKARLKQYEGVDWLALHRQDPMLKSEHETYVRLLEKELATVEGRVTERQTTRTQESEREFANRLEETKQFAIKEIPGWSPELSSKVIQFAADNGVPEPFLRAHLSPTFIKLLHRAYIGEQTLVRQAAKPAPAPAPQPLATVGTKAAPAPRQDMRTLAKSDVVSPAFVAALNKGMKR